MRIIQVDLICYHTTEQKSFGSFQALIPSTDLRLNRVTAAAPAKYQAQTLKNR